MSKQQPDPYIASVRCTTCDLVLVDGLRYPGSADASVMGMPAGMAAQHVEAHPGHDVLHERTPVPEYEARMEADARQAKDEHISMTAAVALERERQRERFATTFAAASPSERRRILRG